MQRATANLRALIRRGNFLELPSAYDPITARLAESLGFKTVYNGGFVTGGSSCISEPLLTMSGGGFVVTRKQVEDLIGLETYYRIERETVEKIFRKKGRKR